MGKRQDAASETRRCIIAAAKALLSEKPAEQINIEEITTKAGVAKGSFYTYFKRKEDLISEIALDEYNILSDLVIHRSADVSEQLCVYLKESVAIIEKNTLQIAQQWMKSVVSPLQEEWSGTRKYSFDCQNITAILSAALNEGRLKKETPVEALGEIIVNAYYGTVAAWCINSGGEGELISRMEQFCSLALKSLIDRYRSS